MKVQQLNLGLSAQPREAPVDALPDVLRAPAWRQPRPAPISPAGLSLTIPEHPCTVRWASGERLQHLRPPRPHSERLHERLSTELAEDRGQLWMLGALSDAVALRLWNSTPASRWSRLPAGALLSLLARFEAAALPGFLRNARRDPAALCGVLSRLHTPLVAPTMAQALRRRSGRGIARRWLLQNPNIATLGLIPNALGAEPRDALLALRLLEQHGAARTIQNTAAGFGPRVSAWIGRWLARSPLLDVPSRRPKMPGFWAPEELHRPTLQDGSPLPLPAIQHLGELLCFTPVAPAYAGLADVRRVCDADSLDAFIVDVFLAWEAAGCPPQHDWPLWGLGHLGGDRAARVLAGRIRSWPGQGGASRAVRGLSVLCMINTPIARLYLHHIAETTRYAGLRQSARAALGELARQEGVSLSTLLDRHPPTLGLDREGRSILDFGTRRFTVTFDADLKPQVQDQRGRPLRALPRPGRRDVVWRAETAWQTFRTLRADVRTLATTWARRMERLMCHRRQLSAEAFQGMLTHPVLGHCAAGLIWAAYTPASERLFCFRITEDFSLAGCQGEPVLLPREARIGIPHRLNLSDEDAASWAALLAAQGITAPFSQLDRPTFRPNPDEQDSLQIARFLDQTAPAGRLMALLSRGWQWGEATETGFAACHRPIPGTPCIAMLPLSPGVAHVAPGDQKLGPLTLRRTDGEGPLPPARLSALQFSELLCDLSGLLDA